MIGGWEQRRLRKQHVGSQSLWCVMASRQVGKTEDGAAPPPMTESPSQKLDFHQRQLGELGSRAMRLALRMLSFVWRIMRKSRDRVISLREDR